MDFNARGTAGGDGPGAGHADGRTRMPFGKHKNQPLDEIPDSYLLWTLDNLDWSNRPTLKEAIRDRLGLNRPKGEANPGPDLDAAIKAWYRRLALDFHPDRRGSHEAMLAINEAHDRLRKALKL